MIVCSCNVLSDTAIRRCVAEHEACAGRMSDVFGALGCRPQCGRCAPTVRRLIRETAGDALSCPAVADTPSVVAFPEPDRAPRALPALLAAE